MAGQGASQPLVFVQFFAAKNPMKSRPLKIAPPGAKVQQ
jgi:hypothetical protein